MQALVTASARFLLGPDGDVWTTNGVLGYPFWTRYLAAYDRVTLVVRAQSVGNLPGGAVRVTGPQVMVAPLVAQSSPIVLWRGVRRILAANMVETMAVHLRVPCIVGSIVRRQLPGYQPYAVEVVGDPNGVFAPGAFDSPLRAVYRRLFAMELERDVAGAVGAAYVTREKLQARYPPAPDAVVTSFSSIDLGKSAFRGSARLWGQQEGRRIIYVGSLERPYKGVGVLLKAVSILRENGSDVHLSVVGDGRLRPSLEKQAQLLGIRDRVSFVGYVRSGEAVAQQLDQADLFVLPSHTEGLPRALIEAMARALPCVGTTVGGIPELLPPSCLVPPGDPGALAGKIAGVLGSPSRLEEMSVRNLECAQAFSRETLHELRSQFYRAVAERVRVAAQEAKHPGTP